MDWGKSFTYIFDDKDWITKVLVGGILSMIPIVNLVVLGYALKALKNVAEGVEQPLPTWDDFADYFVKGLISMVGAFVWALPIIALIAMAGLLDVLTGHNSTEGSRAAALCIWTLSCLSGIYGLFLGLVLPAAFVQYAVRGDWGAFFRFGDIFKFIRANIGNYIVALILAWVAQFIAGFGVILCIIGTVFTEFWATLVGSHLLGQVWRSGEVGPPAQVVEPTV